MKALVEYLLLISILVLMSGCKLAVIDVEGGEVQSTASGICMPETVCVVDVTEPNFSETFTAVPNSGWYFQKWNSGDNFFCGGSTIPICALSFDGYEEPEKVEDMIASSEMFYLMPVFKPNVEIITFDDKQWRQPDQFANLSWADINAVCPEGICIDGEKLNGHDMTGWTWASVDELNSLFNDYLGAELLGPGLSEYVWDGDSPPPNRNFVNNFYSDGWRAISSDSLLNDRPPYELIYARAITGYTSGDIGNGMIFYNYVNVSDMLGQTVEIKGTVFSGAGPSSDVGAWFYRAL